VFREVGQGGVSYFSAAGREELKIAIEIWLKKYSKNTHPKSHDFKISTWNECSVNIKNFLL